MDISKDIIINNKKLNIFLNENINLKKEIHQYNKNDFHCCVCLDDNIEKDKIVQYNHCGNIYIHEVCLYKWFSENNECILCKKKIIEKEKKENSQSNSNIFNNTIIHNRYQHFFNVNDDEEIEYDNEYGNDMQHFIHMHPIYIHNIPSFTFCIHMMKVIPIMSIIIIIYEIYNYIG
jgi:hypothetical protein